AGYNAFAQIDLAGFTIGSRFARWAEPTFFGEENESFGFGASYTLESWTVGVDWSRGDYDEAFLDVNSGETSDVIAFTSSYDLRPGVRINGLLEYSEEEPAPSGAADGALTVGIGTLINF
ncbi:MAG: porin, partial [Dongiaceae bacterium]